MGVTKEKPYDALRSEDFQAWGKTTSHPLLCPPGRVCCRTALPKLGRPPPRKGAEYSDDSHKWGPLGALASGQEFLG